MMQKQTRKYGNVNASIFQFCVNLSVLITMITKPLVWWGCVINTLTCRDRSYTPFFVFNWPKPPAGSVVTFIPWFPLLIEDLIQESTSEHKWTSTLFKCASIIWKPIEGTGTPIVPVNHSWTFLHKTFLEVKLLHVNATCPRVWFSHNKCAVYISPVITSQ